MTDSIKQAAVEAAVDSVVKAAAADPSRMFLFLTAVTALATVVGIVYLFLDAGCGA